jgi:hypothetical protein
VARPWCQSALKILLEVGCRIGSILFLRPVASTVTVY